MRQGRRRLSEYDGLSVPQGYAYSPETVHKYMNTEMGLHSIVHPKKPHHMDGKPHQIFENHDVRYNCTIIDLYDQSVVASITDRHITSDLTIRTLQKALESQPAIKAQLILHSYQGTQYTSKAFTAFCESVNITQSMSKAGYPYDNAPMERYFNT